MTEQEKATVIPTIIKQIESLQKISDVYAEVNDYEKSIEIARTISTLCNELNKF